MRKQNGWLRVDNGKWAGTWRTGPNGTRRNITLGRADELTEDEAQKRLRAIIDQDTGQFEALQYLSTPLQKRKRPFVPRAPGHAGTMGAASELVVALDLLEKGFNVYKAISPTAPCDLMICDSAGEHRLRIEVKTATTPKNRKAYVKVDRNLGHFDVLAIVHPDGIDYRTHSGIKTPRVLLENSDCNLTAENGLCP